jgi:hypothetical protein
MGDVQRIAPMFKRLFHDHPASLGESYGEHFRAAFGFGVAMIVGGIACIVHALVPSAFQTTGSGTVKRLYELMVAKRAAKREANIEMASIEWVI